MRVHGRSALLGAVLFSPMKALRVAQKLGKVLLWWLLGIVVLARMAWLWWLDQSWLLQTFLIFAAVLAVGVWLMLATLHRPQQQVGVAVRAERKPMPQRLRQQIADRDRWTCGICLLPIAKVDDLHIDHIHPVHAGGTDDPENLQASHDDCNRRKGAMVGWQPPYQRDAPEGWA